MYCSWLGVHAWPTGTKREAACPPCCCESWHEIRTRLQLLPLTHHFWRRPDVATHTSSEVHACGRDSGVGACVAVDKTKCRKLRACPCETDRADQKHQTAEKTDVSSRNQIENHRSGLRKQFLAPIWVWFRSFLKTWDKDQTQIFANTLICC